jgi:predicted amidohydrolase YtcJ
MDTMIAHRFALLSGLALCAAPARSPAQRAGADIVFRGGTVYTADPANPRARAVAVAGGKIVYVGGDAGAAAWVGPKTRVVELKGRLLLPGFEDSHVHPATGGITMGQCPLEADTTRAMVLAHIAKCARELAGTGWLQGRGWALPIFPAANPSRQLLDSLAPGRPAFVRAADGHSAWVNTRALEIAGITAATPDPPRGRIERDATGAPSGTLREDAMDLVWKVMPPRTVDDYVRGLRRSMKYANSLGITTLMDATADSIMLEAYARLDGAGELTVRVVAAQQTDPAAGVAQVKRLSALRAQFAGQRLRATSAKIYADGVIEAHTSALLEPYLDTHDTGPSELSPATMDSLVIALDRAGFQVHVHAIGDRAVRMSLDAFAAARAANGVRDTRHQISHLEMIDTLDVPRFAQLAVLANFQALWAFRDSYVRDLTEPVLGPERSSRLYPIASVARTGGTIVGGSDWIVSSLDPLQAIQVGVTRRDPAAPAGPAWIPNEAVPLDLMLRAYTINGAFANFQERETGSIVVGKAADLVLLDRDVLAGPPHEIDRARVMLTFLDGVLVYDARKR